jgi:adenylate cyclase
VIGLPMIFLFPWRSPLRATIATLAALIIVVTINMTLWQWLNWVLSLAPGLLMVALLFVVNMSLGYFVESKAKKQFTHLFGQYVPPELVEEMSRNPENYSMAGRRAELTVLFSDVRGFTTISERMEPEALAALMNEYLGTMTEAIRQRGGTLDKYIGDAIMAFWGAPVANPRHARDAVLSALDMLAALAQLNVRLAARGIAPMKIGIGINTGPMTVGDMGSQIRLAYTVMGDAVNLGARLEGKTKDYGVAVMVGENTRAAVGDVVFRELDRVQVKGKEDPVAVFEPIGLDGAIAPPLLEELALWAESLAAYRQQEWDHAEALLTQLQQRNPGHALYALYRERIAALRITPPTEDWNGVTRFDTK